MSGTYTRGVVVKGPDLLAEHDYRPYVCLSDDSRPFSDEEALYGNNDDATGRRNSAWRQRFCLWRTPT